MRAVKILILLLESSGYAGTSASALQSTLQTARNSASPGALDHSDISTPIFRQGRAVET